MKLDIGGEETFEVPIEALWSALNDPEVLKKCIPGCKDMIPEGKDAARAMQCRRLRLRYARARQRLSDLCAQRPERRNRDAL